MNRSEEDRVRRPLVAYRRLLRLLPREFRAEHAEEMEAVFREALEEGSRRGRAGKAAAWLRGILDVAWQSFRLRLPPRPPRKRQSRGVGRKRILIDGIGLDLKQAIRSLLHAPTYTIVALATLILGIGANAAIFSVVDTVLFRPPAHVQDPEELV